MCSRFMTQRLNQSRKQKSKLLTTKNEFAFAPTKVEVYTMLQAALQSRGETRVLFSQAEPLKPPSRSPDQMFAGNLLQGRDLISLDALEALVAEKDDSEQLGGLPDELKQMLLQEPLEPRKRTSPPGSRDSATRLKEALALFAHADRTTSDEDLAPRTKRFRLDADDYEAASVLPEIYRDMCPSVSKFELVTSAYNEWMQQVEILPNTWVWTTYCVRPDSPCPAADPKVVAKCRQKQAWVQAFARNQKNDPWRWHWIAINSSCNCGISIRT
ncbi:hypothetical protein CAPTEDRAFT_213103 [Capitella teleta]|uniref:Uncharacterized protein n=1 Tax=Capitella teleta TaxID=283909 RepID=R7VIF7_CAPTE|nr:hypothetical protein CAPTEDRAFT_213103 [Capitella teleta]|eukprot:ELU18399.1 hypothetical protein CAPTEDRAFT_213103 [Capitella teleta]